MTTWTKIIAMGSLLCVSACDADPDATCVIDRRGTRDTIVAVSGDCRGQDLRGKDLQNADVDQVQWGDTICPDGTNSDDHGGTCEGHLDPRPASEPPRDMGADLDKPDLPDQAPQDLFMDDVEAPDAPDVPAGVDTCNLTCPVQEPRCEEQVLVTTGEGTLTPDCQCDYSASTVREDCLRERGLWCAGAQCDVPVANEGFVSFAASQFIMGTNSEDDRYHETNENRQSVTLTQGFWLQQTEVTRGQYQAITGQLTEGGCAAMRCPAVQVTWADAAKYTNALSLREGLAPCYTNLDAELPQEPSRPPYPCEGYRLPSEAEWEAACSQNVRMIWACGNTLDCLEEHAWYGGSGAPEPVATKSATAMGLYDMSGNASEWVHDFYTHQYPGQQDPYVARDPLEDSFWGARGGNILNSPPHVRCSKRAGIRIQNSHLGFRVARSILP